MTWLIEQWPGIIVGVFAFGWLLKSNYEERKERARCASAVPRVTAVGCCGKATNCYECPNRLMLPGGPRP